VFDTANGLSFHLRTDEVSVRGKKYGTSRRGADEKLFVLETKFARRMSRQGIATGMKAKHKSRSHKTVRNAPPGSRCETMKLSSHKKLLKVKIVACTQVNEFIQGSSR
jgi:hypothetical protein